MKTTILYLFIFIHLLAFSQNTVRDGFVRVDEVGKIPFIPNYPGANCINFGDYITYFFYYDTCIQTKKYKKVLDERGYNIIRSFIREENRKIFTYYPKSGKESLLYDFNLVKGDTIYIKQAFTGYGWLKCDSLSDDSIMKIVKRDTIEFLYGSMRKVIYFKPRITAEETKWVEGIGSINSIFFDPAGILALSVFPYCNLKDTQDFEGLPLNMDTFCGQEISLVNGDFKFISKPLGYYSNIPLLSYFTHENLPPFYLSPRCDTPSIVDTVQVSKCHCCQPSTYHLPRIIASKDKGNCRDTIRFTVVWDYPQAGVGYKWISDSILIIQPDSMTTIHKIQIQSVSPDTVCNRIFTLDYSTFCSPCKDSIYKSIYMPRVLNIKPRDTFYCPNPYQLKYQILSGNVGAYFKFSVQNPLKYYLGISTYIQKVSIYNSYCYDYIYDTVHLICATACKWEQIPCVTLSSDKDFAFLNDTIHFTQSCLNNCLQYNYLWDNGDSVEFIPQTYGDTVFTKKLIFWNQSNIKDSLIKNVIIKKKNRITNQNNITRIPFRISDEKLYIDIFIEENTEVILTDIIGRVLYREKGKNLIELSKFEKQILILKVNKEDAKAEIFLHE